MSIFKNVQNLLKEKSISHEVLEHEPVFTMQQAAEVCEHSPEQGVKTLLIKLYQTKRQFEYWLVVWQGDEMIPLNVITKQLSYKKWKLVQPEEVLAELSIEIGALAPLGYERQYPVIFDQQLLEQKQVFINAGVHNRTIRLSPIDMFRVLQDVSIQVQTV